MSRLNAKTGNRLKLVYETVSFAMVLLFALLPLFITCGPSKYGVVFKMYARIEIGVLLSCALGYIIYFIFRAKKASLKQVFSDMFSSCRTFVCKQRQFVLFAVFFILVIISAYNAKNFDRAFEGSDFRPDGILMYACFMSLYIFAISLKTPVLKKIVVGVYIGVFVFVGLIMLQQYYGILGTEFSKYCPKDGWMRELYNFYEKHNIRVGLFYRGTTGTFYNSNHMGYYAAMSTLLCAAHLIKSKKIVSAVAFSLLTAFGIWVIIVNNTFGAYIAVGLTLAVFAVSLVFIQKQKFANAILPLLIFVLVSTYFSCMPGIRGANIIKTNITTLKSDVAKISDDSKDSESVGKAGSGRWALWTGTANIIKDKPLLGCGPDNVYLYKSQYNIKLDRAHNEVIEQSASTGIPSAIFHLGAVLIVIFGSIRRKNLLGSGLDTSEETLAPLMAAVGYFISSFVGVYLFYTACHFYIMLGMASDTNE